MFKDVDSNKALQPQLLLTVMNIAINITYYLQCRRNKPWTEYPRSGCALFRGTTFHEENSLIELLDFCKFELNPRACISYHSSKFWGRVLRKFINFRVIFHI